MHVTNKSDARYHVLQVQFGAEEWARLTAQAHADAVPVERTAQDLLTAAWIDTGESLCLWSFVLGLAGYLQWARAHHRSTQEVYATLPHDIMGVALQETAMVPRSYSYRNYLSH